MTRKPSYPPEKLPVAPHYNIRSDHALRVFADSPTPTTAKHLIEVLRDELLSGRLGSRKANYIFGVLYGYMSRLESEALLNLVDKPVLNPELASVLAQPRPRVNVFIPDPTVTSESNANAQTETPPADQPDVQPERPAPKWRPDL